MPRIEDVVRIKQIEGIETVIMSLNGRLVESYYPTTPEQLLKLHDAKVDGKLITLTFDLTVELCQRLLELEGKRKPTGRFK